MHPGTVDTNIWSGAPLWSRPFIALLLRPFFISAREGGAFIVQLAVDPALEGVTGKYFEKGVESTPAPLARDEGSRKTSMGGERTSRRPSGFIEFTSNQAMT